MESEAFQQREAECEQRHDREHRRVDEAHRAQAQVAEHIVAQQRVHVAGDVEPSRHRLE
jgi:hypothetical protein